MRVSQAVSRGLSRLKGGGRQVLEVTVGPRMGGSDECLEAIEAWEDEDYRESHGSVLV